MSGRHRVKRSMAVYDFFGAIVLVIAAAIVTSIVTPLVMIAR